MASPTSRPSWRHHRGGASSDLSLLGLLPASLLGEAGHGCKLLLLFRRVSSSGVSASSALSLMVSEYQMPGVPPLPPFPSNPVDGVGWWYVDPDVLEDVTIISMGGRRVR